MDSSLDALQARAEEHGHLLAFAVINHDEVSPVFLKIAKDSNEGVGVVVETPTGEVFIVLRYINADALQKAINDEPSVNR